MNLNEYRDLVHKTAVSKGWWEGDKPRSFGDLIALCHSELSETLEEFRNGHDVNELYFQKIFDGYDTEQFLEKPEGVPVELVDVLIRIFDMCGWYGIDLEHAFQLKAAFNETRPHRHGGKTL